MLWNRNEPADEVSKKTIQQASTTNSGVKPGPPALHNYQGASTKTVKNIT